MKTTKIIRNFYYFLNYEDFLKKEEDNEEVFLKITDRNFFIDKCMVGFKVAVYNGKFFIPFKITESMVGHMIGAFSFTRSVILKKKKKKKK